MQRVKHENQDLHYHSDRLRRKMKVLATSNTAIIEAPSGCGKTTAMRDYLNTRAAKDDIIHWFVAVDEEAPSVLYRRLCREIGRIDSSIGERLLEIDFPNAFTIGDVCDALRSIKSSKNSWLIIDDFQFLYKILPASFLSALLEAGGHDLRIIIITQMLGMDFQKSIKRHGMIYVTASDLQWTAEDIRNYFKLVGEVISVEDARDVERITDGWIIAVHLQLCSYLETGGFSDDAVLQLMEHLIWDKMTPEQQDFFMKVSVMETGTVNRLCRILQSSTLPEFAADSLAIPFIRYIADQQLCVPHTLLRELVCIKRRQKGEAFDIDCTLKVADVYRDEGELAEAVFFYIQVKNYQRILQLDLSHLICAEIGDRTFNDIALEIIQNCSMEIKSQYLHSMLCVAWAVRFFDHEGFVRVMDELDQILPKSGHLRAEWLLLSVYLHYPKLSDMITTVQNAAGLFDGACSSVIFPEVPWAFYEYMQLSTFHIREGAADEEAALLEEFTGIYSQLTGGHGAGADALFRAELAFFRCETEQAEILAHKAFFLSESNQQKIIQIGAVRLLAVIALLKSDLASWQRAVNDVEHAALGSMQNTLIYKAMLDVAHGSLMAQLREYDRIADWLKNSTFMSAQLPAAIYCKALEIHAYYLMGKGEYAQMIGFLQSVPIEDLTPFPEHFHFFTRAVGYSSLGDKTQAVSCIEHSAKISLPDDMLHCFVGFSRLLNGLSDELIKERYPGLLSRFDKYKERYFTGWFALYRAITQYELPNALTGREREIAELAAEGLRNIEIAKRLFLSEHTVRAHLRSIYQKLDIDRRAKLVKVLN